MMISVHRGVFSLGIVCALIWASAAPATLVDKVSNNLQERLQADPQLKAGNVILHHPALVKQFYVQRVYRPAWSEKARPLPSADKLLEAVDRAKAEGLRPADYHWNQINRALTEVQSTNSPTAVQLANLDLLLTDAFLTYGSQLLAGRPSKWVLTARSGIKPRSRDMVAVLEDALARDAVTPALESLKPAYPKYARLRRALAHYRMLEQRGGWPTISDGPKLTLGSRGPRVRELLDRLRVSGELAGVANGSGDANPGDVNDYRFDETLLEAVKRFQRRHGLTVDGVVGRRTLAELNVSVAKRVQQIELNLERLRWLPEDLGTRHILVHITNFEMSVVEEGEEVLKARAIVGKAKRPTPVFSGTMSHLVLSPRWYVPHSIAVKDKLPKLRKDAYSLYRQGIHIFDANGQEVNPGTVDWHAVGQKNFHYRLLQYPGPVNALGRIKFMFSNPHQVYLHDTPYTHLFNRTKRTFSSGCVRISKPIELAEYLLGNDSRWDRTTIDAASRRGRERHVKLPREIPVHLLYWTAWVEEDGMVNFRKDIYGRDEKLSKAIFST